MLFQNWVGLLGHNHFHQPYIVETIQKCLLLLSCLTKKKNKTLQFSVLQNITTKTRRKLETVEKIMTRFPGPESIHHVCVMVIAVLHCCSVLSRQTRAAFSNQHVSAFIYIDQCERLTIFRHQPQVTTKKQAAFTSQSSVAQTMK